VRGKSEDWQSWERTENKGSSNLFFTPQSWEHIEKKIGYLTFSQCDNGKTNCPSGVAHFIVRKR